MGEENGAGERGEHDKLDVTIRQRKNSSPGPQDSQDSVNWEEVTEDLKM